MQVDVWSDVMCPWCAVGRAQLLEAKARFEAENDEPVTFRWRAFELDPNAPVEREGDYVAMLARKYGRSRDEMQQMVHQMTARGAQVGVRFDFDSIRPGNTFDAHRLLHLAEAHGMQDALKARLFEAYFAEGAAVGRPEVLQQLAEDAGLPSAEVADVLATDRFADAVRGEEQLARQLGVNGVPFFVFDQRVAVSGAQPTEVLLQALAHALDTREPTPSAEDGEVCGPDGCAV
jgi:predicted DsbA family dithiol-disulfide isomerase